MTVKEIAKLAGKSTRTVQRWIEEARRQNVLTRRQNVTTKQYDFDFTLEDTITIIKAGGNETLANLLLDNANQNQKSISTTLTQRDQDLISNIVSTTIAKTIEILDRRMSSIETCYENRQALLPAPKKTDRANLNEIVRSCAHKNNIPHASVWGSLYKETNYRLNKNIRVLAENKKLKPLDYLEKEGLISTVLSIALEILQ